MQLHSSDGQGEFNECLLACGLGQRARFEGFDYTDNTESFYEKAAKYLAEESSKRQTTATGASGERFKSILQLGLEFLKRFFGEGKVCKVVDAMYESSPCSRLLDLLNLGKLAPPEELGSQIDDGDSQDSEDAPLVSTFRPNTTPSLIGLVDTFEIMSLLTLFDPNIRESNQLREIIAKVCVEI